MTVTKLAKHILNDLQMSSTISSNGRAAIWVFGCRPSDTLLRLYQILVTTVVHVCNVTSVRSLFNMSAAFVLLSRQTGI